MTPQSDVALAPMTTMGVGGPARWFVDATSESALAAALKWAADRNVAVCILGGGSNVIISDEGIDGLVIRVGIAGTERAQHGDRVVYLAGAGEPWDGFVAQAVAAGCAGLECLSGIPGFVGGTPVQNVGAYGQEVSDTITRVRVIDRRTGAWAWLSNAECGFGYRTSRFKTRDANRFVVTRVEFSLAQGGAATVRYADLIAHFAKAGISAPSLGDVREATLDIRRCKGMVIEDGAFARRSCGSFFVNPVIPREQFARIQGMYPGTRVPSYDVSPQMVKVPAAWLIERSGFPRGFTRDPVGVSPFQAQAIVNLGGAQAADVVALAGDIKRAIHRTFGILLVPEPVFLGFGPSPELTWLLGDGPSKA